MLKRPETDEHGCVQFAMAARHLSQAGSVFPLKTLTSEQVAQVQQQIQTSNQFQNNLQARANLSNKT